jgi:hypothetical protein
VHERNGTETQHETPKQLEHEARNRRERRAVAAVRRKIQRKRVKVAKKIIAFAEKVKAGQ